MKPLLTYLKDGLIILGLGLLLLLGMLLVALLVRPLLILAMIVFLATAVFSVFSPRVRAWLESSA
jgi:hypothetical protein